MRAHIVIKWLKLLKGLKDARQSHKAYLTALSHTFFAILLNSNIQLTFSLYKGY